jgi:predicted LPLAT superfamily acyltransferase
MSDTRVCAVIPTFNHCDALDRIVSRLDQYVPATIVVDDGSIPEAAARIRAICERHSNAEYLRLAANGGKGAAVLSGIARAGDRGFTHALQIDADGQHNLDDLAPLLAMARQHPEAIVTGIPQFDRSMPFSRRFWRGFTTFWVRVNTLSFTIRDAMCGFRVYPIEPVLALARKSVRSCRMDFDVEILVKAYWQGMMIAAVPVRVTYPTGNFSNFRVLRDNLLLSLLQTRLFFGMVLRSPTLIARHFRRTPRDAGETKWPDMKERGAYWGLRLLVGIYHTLGRKLCLFAMAPVIFYFFMTGRAQREASKEYLNRLWQSGYLREPPTTWTSFRHFMSFGAAGLDKLAAWTGDISEAEVLANVPALLHEVESSGRGAFIITAHIGSPEVIRAVAVLGRHVPVNVLMHIEHARLFNRLITELSPSAPVRAIPVTKVGADTAIQLTEAIARGEWVVIVGDRVPVARDGRVVEVPFLGGMSPLPQGPYILGALLKAPVYLMFCVRGKRGFDVHFSKFADRIELPRGNREGAIRNYAMRFAKALEARVAETPMQWFNFYSFWSAQRDPHPSASATQRAVE